MLALSVSALRPAYAGGPLDRSALQVASVHLYCIVMQYDVAFLGHV